MQVLFGKFRRAKLKTLQLLENICSVEKNTEKRFFENCFE